MILIVTLVFEDEIEVRVSLELLGAVIDAMCRAHGIPTEIRITT